jgi:hypothetical protein
MKVKHRQLKRSRPGSHLTQFVGYFQARGLSADVPIAVYRYLSGLPWMHDFPIDPKDKLGDVCRIGVEELGDAYPSILADIRRELPESRRRDAFLVETVKEMVQFVAELPTKGGATD